MIVIEIALLIVVVLLSIPTLVVSAECLLALLPGKKSHKTSPTRESSLVVLIPAHNEEHTIGAAIDSILPQLHSQDRILVVADHCTDDTAGKVLAAGVSVLERTGNSPRGKGHTLNAGIDSLRNDPPDIVLVVDADCVLEPGSLDILAATILQTSRPAQSRYIMRSSDRQGILDQISAFAFLVRNVVRPLGLARIGQPCHLMGTGMAFPWSLLEKTPVPTDHTVEDLQMGIELLQQGFGPVFCDGAQVTSDFPPSQEGSEQQHKRWTHGHLRTIQQNVPPQLGQAILRRRLDLALATLDLAVPPLSLLVVLIVGTLAAAALVALFGGPILPFLFLSVFTTVFFAAILAAWSKFGRGTLSGRALLKIPLYAIKKIPGHLGFFTKPVKTWQNRSERNSD